MKKIFLLNFFAAVIDHCCIMSCYPSLKTSPEFTQYMVGKSLVSIGKCTYYFSDLEILELFEGAPLTIGKFSSISHKVTIFLGMYHHSDWVTTFPFAQLYTQYFAGQDIVGHPTTKGGVIIGNDVWIGRGATIMSGVTIGDGAIIGACSVVTKDVESYAIAAGNPARHIKYRFEQAICHALQRLRWWDLETEQIKEIAHSLCSFPSLEKIDFWLKKYRNEN